MPIDDKQTRAHVVKVAMEVEAILDCAGMSKKMACKRFLKEDPSLLEAAPNVLMHKCSEWVTLLEASAAVLVARKFDR